MYDSNIKSQRTLLYAVDSEYVYERTIEFRSKIVFESRVINFRILMTQYLDFEYSVTFRYFWIT